jgi:RecA-family ATPase
MAIVRELTREDLVTRRDDVLRSVGLSSAELKERAESGGLVGAEWSAWEEIQEIEYLLSDA